MARTTTNGLKQKALPSRNVDTMDVDQNAFEPPPSTLAAQLVNNISSTRKPQRTPSSPSSRDAFSTLVFQIKTFEDLPEEEKNGEQLISHNRRTVYVLTIAILDKLSSSSSDPFTEPDQAALAIDALVTAVQATPEVLVRVMEEGGLVDTGKDVPLWLWLFPRLLRLVGKSGTDGLWDKIARFFKAAFEAVRGRGSEFWGLERRWLAYLRHSADAALHHIEGTATVKLPLGSIGRGIGSADGENVSSERCSYELKGGADAFHQADILFMVLVELFCSPAPVVAKSEDVNELNSHALWIFESFLELRTKAARANIYADRQEEVMTCSTSINTVHRILIAMEKQLTDAVKRKGYRVLTHLLDELISYKSPFSEAVSQMDFCSILIDLASVCESSSSLSCFVMMRLIPGLRHFVHSIPDTSKTEFGDILKCFTLLNTSCENAQTINARHTEPGAHDRNLQSKELEKQLQSLSLEIPGAMGDGDGDERQAKRRRLEPKSLLTQLTETTYELLGLEGTNDVEALSQMAAENFASLSERKQSEVIEMLGHIPCAAASTLTITWNRARKIGESECAVCDLLEGPTSDKDSQFLENLISDVEEQAIAVLSSLVKTPEFERSQKLRILAMITLRKFALHFDDPVLLNLEQSELAKWCFSSLKSKARELRITAGRTLPAFLRDSKDPLTTQRNRVLALDGLKQISDGAPMHLIETLVLAWGQVAAVSKNRELNFALLRLVEYLGHSYEVIVAAASNEIMNTAEAHGVSVQQLFSPFWSTFAYPVVKDLQTRPQLTQSFADLLELTIPDLLVTTQTHTLPWLVLDNCRDVIARISQARGDADEGEVIVSNLAIIMSRLLTQSKEDLEAYIVRIVQSYGLKFEDEFTIYLRSASVMVSSELLKMAGEEGEGGPNRARHALNYLANQCAPPNSTKGKRRQLGVFLEQHGLGIMSHFSDVLNDALTWQSSTDKIRCLRAIQEMVTLGKSHIKPALPQIYACLQSALSHDELRSAAFQAWGTMIKSLDDEDVTEMLESTFCTIIQQWSVFDAPTRQYAKDLIDGILKRVRELGVVPEMLPKLEQIPELQDQQLKLNKLYNEKNKNDVRIHLGYFVERLSNGNASCATQALHELAGFLRKNQDFLQASAVSEQPDKLLPQLLRTILDTCVKFNGRNLEIARLSGECIGLIGCIDPNMVEATHEQENIVVVSNFEEWDDTTDFVIYLLEKVLVKAFLSAATMKAQNFLAYTMQDLLFKCGITQAVIPHSRKGSALEIDDPEHAESLLEKWMGMPNPVRMTLTPFLRSKYQSPHSTSNAVSWPIFDVNKTYKTWLRTFVRNLLGAPHNEYARCIFEPLELAVRIDDISVANFLLPYVVLHSVVAGDTNDHDNIIEEILMIISLRSSDCKTHSELTALKMCSEAIFRILDYLALWHQETAKYKSRTERSTRTIDKGLKAVASLLSSIPAEMTSERAVDCSSYARALCHYEAHIRKTRDKLSEKTPEAPVPKDMLEHLQKIYTQIDEPDGIEGIGAHLNVLDIDQQVLGHRKAGRLTAAQSWYEIKIAEKPDDIDAQVNLLHCMKESGQHDVLLNYVEGMTQSEEIVQKLLPFATEASWATGRMDMLEKFVSIAPKEIGGDFNINIGRALLAVDQRDYDEFEGMINALREHIAGSMTTDNTSSLRSCHDSMLKLHALSELEMIALSADKTGWGPDWTVPNAPSRPEVLVSLDKRLEVVGAYIHDKQYLLGLRRATMGMLPFVYQKEDLAASWLTSARLARKDNSVHQSYNAVLHASNLGDHSAMIEHARLIWKEGNHRKAIRSLQGAIDSNVFANQAPNVIDIDNIDGNKDQQNLLAARAHLLLAKWLDQAAQTSTTELRKQYQKAAQLHQSWERGHYYLGRHYNKLLETQKLLPRSQQSDNYVTGEMGKIVVENYLRSLNYGTKYVYQTLPRIITLWLDLGMQVSNPSPDEKYGTAQAMATVQMHRKQQLDSLHTRFEKYIPKMPAYIFYTALPQIIARIAHPNNQVYKYLSQIIMKVVTAHPQHALWAVLAVATSTQSERNNKGKTLLLNLTKSGDAGMVKTESGMMDMRKMITSGEELSKQLLLICNTGDFPGSRTVFASLTKECGFKGKKCLPSPLAVPVESVLTATLPTLTGSVKSHKAFSRDIVTINHFSDTVMIMSSLAKPRKLTALGSDGKKYGLLCKPKDDLRKDQRLMEFNSMINRSLKRDAESSKRQLYIKTYAVTPLNEECGIIEWVDGLKTLRDIVLGLYADRGVQPNYSELKHNLARAADEPDEKKRHDIYYNRVMKGFPPVFHLWFASQFPEPGAWFNARLRYTRSCAVMSMIGHVLGLGDRHGENILFEEGNGGTFHVDFNCLFDKGQTFTQPERVPFRLTHNMVDAMGVYGYEGPFRTSSELTLKLLRQHEETLMTILESFLYDPTLDLLEAKEEIRKKGKQRERKKEVPTPTPQGVLDTIRRKLRGLMGEETVPLGVEGQVESLILEATSERNLASMYIGWCAFF